MPKKKKNNPKTIVKYRPGKIKYRTRNVPKKIYVKKRAKGLIAGMNLPRVFTKLLPLGVGMLVCKFAAKQFAEGGGDREDWSWKNYALGGGATILAGILSSAIFRTRSHITETVILGGLGLTLYKILINEVAAKNATLTSWFGQDEDIYPEMSGFIGQDEPLHPDYGDIYQSEEGPEEDVVYGASGEYFPVNEMHRMPVAADDEDYDDVGVDIQPADPTFGVDIQPADPTFGQSVIDDYTRAYTR